jgi:hypothetical protein
MKIDLTAQEIDRILESLDYSEQAVSAPPDTPSNYRTKDLALINAIRSKLRAAKTAE